MDDLIERLRDGVAREASGRSALWDALMKEAADALEQAQEIQQVTELGLKAVESAHQEAEQRIEVLEAAILAEISMAGDDEFIELREALETVENSAEDRQNP